jgi:hypothetical protein
VKPPIGFVLATHANPAQILFLCEQLSARFDRPPISIHHDFGQTPLNTALFPTNVHFVEDWVKTRWGGFGVVEGEFRALRQLYQKDDPDWFFNISSADHPIKTAKQILDELYSNPYDAYIDTREIRYCRLPVPPEGWGDQNFIAPAWVTLAFERYMAIGFGYYKLATRMGWRKKAIYLRGSFFVRNFTPFDGSLKCFAGDHWFTANREAAEAILADSDSNRRLYAHFRRRPNSDEAIFQTILGNTALRLSTDNKRYTDWRGCTNHPRTLTEADFPALFASGDYFARKFDFNPDLLHKLNQRIDKAQG